MRIEVWKITVSERKINKLLCLHVKLLNERKVGQGWRSAQTVLGKVTILLKSNILQ